MNLLDAWANWSACSAPFIYDDDQKVMNTKRSLNATVIHKSWKDAIKAPDFCAPGDNRLHLGLLPQPFFGDVRRASVYILMLNPGLGPTDYYGEYEVPAYRTALLDNLKQKFHNDKNPFLFLDPQFAWHGGFDWWHGKLAKVIECLASYWNISFAEARVRLGSKLASIELIPYHSLSFRDSDKWLRNLCTVKLAKSYVSEFVFPRVRQRKAIVIVTRKVKEWNLPHLDGVFTYTSGQARGAHLTPDSPGGRAILRHFGLPER